MKKIKVYHFNNGSGGGILSVIKNLIQFSTNQNIEHHIIYTINQQGGSAFKIISTPGAVTEQVFYYSLNWNFYYTCKQLARLLPDEKVLILANDWLELGMASNLGLQNKVVQIVHGDYDYYYTLAKLNSAAIDGFIAVSNTIKNKLVSLLPERKNDIVYLRFPVPETITQGANRLHNSVVFVGRCTREKGYFLLPCIAESIRAKTSMCSGILWVK